MSKIGPHVEARRKSREHFTKVLERTCNRLDAQCAFDAQWKSPILGNVPINSRFRVKTLWVVGSYARGARTCGDLDLVVEVANEVESTPEPTMRRLALGSPSDVRPYFGTPQENSSGVAFEEARLVWFGPGSNWRVAVEDIPLTDGNGRFARAADELPLRIEQYQKIYGLDHDGSRDDVEQLLRLRAEQIFEWSFYDADSLSQPPTELSSDEQYLCRVFKNRKGSATKKLIPMLLAFGRVIGGAGEWHYGGDVVNYGGVYFSLGRPSVELWRLKEPKCSHLAIVPHFSRRGPNGIWLIRRGGHHPVTRLFRERHAFIHAESDGGPAVSHLIDGHSEFLSLDIFSTEREATRTQRRFENAGIDGLNVRHIEGQELLDVVALVDLLELKTRKVLAVSHLGTLAESAVDCQKSEVLARMLPRNRPTTQKSKWLTSFAAVSVKPDV